jgi:hypothetical protein
MDRTTEGNDSRRTRRNPLTAEERASLEELQKNPQPPTAKALELVRKYKEFQKDNPGW